MSSEYLHIIANHSYVSSRHPLDAGSLFHIEGIASRRDSALALDEAACFTGYLSGWAADESIDFLWTLRSRRRARVHLARRMTARPWLTSDRSYIRKEGFGSVHHKLPHAAWV